MLELKKSDPCKVVIGQLMRKKSRMPIKWGANKLKLGADPLLAEDSNFCKAVGVQLVNK